MTAKIISKVAEIDNCNKDTFLKVLYKAKFWEAISPVSKIEVEFISPNVFRSVIIDEIKLTVGNLLNIPIEMTGELVLLDKGEVPEKGRLIELNVRNNKDIKELEGRLRIKEVSTNKVKIGIFIHNFILSSDFFNLIGKGAAEITLRTKLGGLIRNLQKYCKTHDLEDLF